MSGLPGNKGDILAHQATTRPAPFLASVPGAQFLPEDTPSRVLAVTIIVSILVHIIVLFGVKFKFPDTLKFPETTPPLEIVLVNSKSLTKPHKADALAQANLDGGGNTDAKLRSSTSTPKLHNEQTAEFMTQQKHVEQLEQEAKKLMAQLKAKKAIEQVLPRPEPKSQPVENINARDIVNKFREESSLEARIAKQNKAYEERPKRRFIGSRTQEYRDALYVEAWRTKVERIGNINYPEAARQQKLYGTLKLTVSIRSDGSVEKVVIDEPSGKKILDEAARRIIELAAPYAKFPPAMLQNTDILDITRTWTFTRDDQFFTE